MIDIDRQSGLGLAVASIFAFIILILAVSYARSETYIRVDGALSSPKPMQGYGVGAAVGGDVGFGYRWAQNFRSDVTLGYRSYKLDGTVNGLAASNGVSSLAAMLNTYWDIVHIGAVTPYVGVGVGVSRNRVGQTTLNGGAASLDGATRTSFAWQASAGAVINLSAQWSLDAGYRYFDMGTASTGDNLSVGGNTFAGFAVSSRLRAHEARLGVRYSF